MTLLRRQPSSRFRILFYISGAFVNIMSDFDDSASACAIDALSIIWYVLVNFFVFVYIIIINILFCLFLVIN